MGILFPRSIYFASFGPERPYYLKLLWVGEETALLQPCRHHADLCGEEDNKPLFQRQILGVSSTWFCIVSLNDQKRELGKWGEEYSRPGRKAKASALVEEDCKSRKL